MVHREMLIDGHFVGGECDQAVGKLVARSPYDGHVVGTAAEGGWNEANAALAAASEAFLSYRRTSVVDRQLLLRRIAQAVRDREAELVSLLIDEVGKPVRWSQGEVSRLALTFDLAAAELDQWGEDWVDLGYDPRGRDYRATVARFPRGVVLGIVPYNWPFNLAAHKLAPALATGNAVVLKPSDQAAVSTLTLARLIHEAGCPHGAVNAVVCPPAVAERAALDLRTSMVSFTGSPAVGWHLKRLLPEKPVTLELGGDGFAVVCADADLAWAVERVVAGAYGYAGQVCIAVQHVLVECSVYEAVREKLIAATNACPYGDPRQESTVCGPMISAEAADRVEHWVSEAVALGAQVIAGGGRSGNVVHPTLVEGVPREARLAREEVFGPVLTLQPFDTFDEALGRVDGSAYGIHCGVFSRDPSKIREAFERLTLGGVVANDYPTLRFDALPYGGEKHSGFGREGVRAAMEEMTVPKTLVERLDGRP